jgi:DNA-binding NarL/FixJ family response regulator
MLVDDNDQYLETAARVLRSQGIDVIAVASDATTALALARSLRLDVVLVDVELGADDGLELVRDIGALTAAPATILISTHSEEELGEALAESPAIGFVPKSRLSGACVRHLLSQVN